MIFGEKKKDRDDIIDATSGCDVATHGIENILVHDETNPAMAYMLSGSLIQTFQPQWVFFGQWSARPMMSNSTTK